MWDGQLSVVVLNWCGLVSQRRNGVVEVSWCDLVWMGVSRCELVSFGVYCSRMVQNRVASSGRCDTVGMV